MSSREKQRRLVIGVDVGGTNTDAALVHPSTDGRGDVLRCHKVPTSPDVSSGVLAAIRAVLDGVDHQSVIRVNIGTTFFLNSILERRNLSRVAVIRLCGKASRSLPPFTGMPEALRSEIDGGQYLVDGGYLFNGREIASIDRDQISNACSDIKSRGINQIVVSGIFSSLKPNEDRESQESIVGDLIKELLPGASVTLSNTVGHLGLVERENASILNECLKPLARKYVSNLRQVFSEELSLKCPFYFTSNDGTVIDAGNLAAMPVLTFSSGPTNSMRGACFLSGVKNGLVVDIGGTTTDVGVLISGFGRPASTRVQIGGVQTNFQMPDVFSFPLGGGSVVKTNPLSIGPESVGFRIKEASMCFGGSSLTTSDLAVKAGLFNLGDPEKLKTLDSAIVRDGLRTIRSRIEEAIDRVKVASDDVEVILVGGGAVIVDTSQPLAGVSKVLRPEKCEVANAVGAAFSQVSGSHQEIVSLDSESQESAVSRIVGLAKEDCVKNGGILDRAEIVEKVTVPLPYTSGNLMQVKVRVVSDLNPEADLRSDEIQESDLINEEGGSLNPDSKLKPEDYANNVKEVFPKFSDFLDWILTEKDVEKIAVGAGVLGCGGGGSPNLGLLHAKQTLNSGHQMRIRSLERFSENRDALALSVAFMGAPSVIYEQLFSNETQAAVAALQEYLTRNPDKYYLKQQGVKVTETESHIVAEDLSSILSNDRKAEPKDEDFAMCCLEIGGLNSLEPLIAAAKLGLSVLDCDGMGRAFPELQMFHPFIQGLQPYPAVLASFDGRVAVAMKSKTPKDLEDVFRRVVVEMGGAAAVSLAPMTVEEVGRSMLDKSYTRCFEIGDAILNPPKDLTPVESLLRKSRGKLLATGKISDVVRSHEGGFNRGHFIVISLEGEERCRVDFQNENLLASLDDQLVATTPTLISVVDSETALPVMTEELRYGLRVCVVALEAPSQLLTEEALKVVGPRAFGYPNDFVPFCL